MQGKAKQRWKKQELEAIRTIHSAEITFTVLILMSTPNGCFQLKNNATSSWLQLLCMGVTNFWKLHSDLFSWTGLWSVSEMLKYLKVLLWSSGVRQGRGLSPLGNIIIFLLAFLRNVFLSWWNTIPSLQVLQIHLKTSGQIISVFFSTQNP